MAGNGRLRHWQGREGSALLRMVAAPGAGCASCHDIRFKLVCNCGRAVVALVRFANNCTTALRSLQFLGVSGCIPDYCASSKTKWLKQLGPGLIEHIRAECEHRLRDLTRAAHASLFDPLLNDLFAGRFDSGAADGFASLSRPLRHGAPCASAADSTSSPARSGDRLPPPTCHLHAETKAPLASRLSTPAAAAPPCLPFSAKVGCGCPSPNAHISTNISSAARACFAFGSSRFIAGPLCHSQPLPLLYPLSSSQNIGMHPASRADRRDDFGLKRRQEMETVSRFELRRAASVCGLSGRKAPD